MSKLNKDTQGFSVVELLLVIIIIILVGFVGWFIYHTDHKNTTASNSASSTTSKSTGYVTIAQWGVRAPYSGSLTLNYSIENASSTLPMDIAYFDSSQLDAAAPSCKGSNQYGGAVSGAVGLIERFSSSQAFVAGDADTSTGQTAAQYAATLSSSDYGHVGNYYFFYVSPQATCATTTTSQTIFNETKAAVVALVPILQAIPSSQ